MSTESQINANRLNSKNSTGPKSPEGKAKVSQNAVTHGLTASRPVLETENHEEYTLFCDDFFRHHAPAGLLEESLTQRAADTFWRLQRAQDYETAVLNTLIHQAAADKTNPNDSDCHSRDLSGIALATAEGGNPDLLGEVLLDDFRKHHTIEKISRYEIRLENSMFRTLKELRTLQSQRLGQEMSTGGTFKDTGSHSDQHPCGCSDSAISQNKPKIPSFDPMKLLENMKTNPFELDPLTKIMMKKDNFRQLSKKVG